jgi:futalosine hydrolase
LTIMTRKILFVTATSSEAEFIRKIHGIQSVPGGYRYGNSEINVLVTGVGSISTAWEMQKWISVNDKPDVAINAGIAGTFKEEIRIGDVVMPLTDCFADAGIEEGDNFLTLSEAGLVSASEFPFREGKIYADPGYAGRLKDILKPVRAITVNTATGSDITRDKLVRKYNPDIETMEGATFFYICSREKIPFLAVRAISNKIEIRNKHNWDIKLALSNLAEKLKDIVLTLE